MAKHFINQNFIVTHGFSNYETQLLYTKMCNKKADPKLQELYGTGCGCLACNFYAPLNFDWGLCLYNRSQHYLESVFEHYTCLSYTPPEDENDCEAHTFTDHHLKSPW